MGQTQHQRHIGIGPQGEPLGIQGFCCVTTYGADIDEGNASLPHCASQSRASCRPMPPILTSVFLGAMPPNSTINNEALDRSQWSLVEVAQLGEL